ncbi:MAG: hypothetical protein RQ745_06190 [Longimicrobiales bacterium]|nr:hypothetical protein [Longimicrobiales bacterium]
MIRIRSVALLPLIAVLAACESNPVLVDDGNLTAELTLSESHVHTLSSLDMEVVIRNSDGYAVDDFEAVTLDQKIAGDDTWRSIVLEASEHGFVGDYVFASTGDYDLRVMVTRHGTTEPTEVPLMHSEMGHLSVARAHFEIDGHRIEFESFPGHMHEGQEVELKFWILEMEANEAGVRPPVLGLDPTIVCHEGGSPVESHPAHGHDDGVYEATHHFAEPGAAAATIRFEDGHGSLIEASFDFDVAHGH